ncbi:MAG TPA: glycerol acyltransferase [Flavobacteriaceae bacterium]|jgi:1-acyl-sn-glycerol-3-phosphate acyltransferase|nr:glycerol acyltransferase [Flavobacteriaceae bacterium]HBS10960.1 glycerol acyltransferase [Flavobacteriaceae bacterium]
MKKIIGSFILFIFGWKCVYPQKFKTDKCVTVAAPHTSNWDLIFAISVYWKVGIKVKFIIKHAYTKGLHGRFFKWLGGIGIDRSKHNNTVDFSVDLLNKQEKIVLMLSAEGTRKYVERWRTGFYHIALNAKVPVLLGYLDYTKKIAGVGDLIHLTGDFEVDMTKFQNFYKDIDGKFPENYNKKIF